LSVSKIFNTDDGGENTVMRNETAEPLKKLALLAINGI
jgi:hypothetical protein